MAQKTISEMEEIKKAIREMSSYLLYGELKSLASGHGVDYQRARDLMRGKTKITDADMQFIDAIYDTTLPRKNKLEKLKAFTR